MPDHNLVITPSTYIPLTVNSDPRTPSQNIGAGAGVFSGLDAIFSQYSSRPAVLKDIIRSILFGIAALSAAVSFIPATSNFGAPMAAEIVSDLYRPFRRRAYDAQVDLTLRPIIPTNELSPRLVVSGVESGALSEQELTEELVRGGTRDESLTLAVKIARLKRFDAETKDDVALVRQYQRDINTAVIKTMQDEESAIIADLKSQRKAILTELRKGGVQVSI